MQKSLQKKMIVLKTDDSQCFEEVYLILKDKMEYTEDSAMVEEANRIIQHAQSQRVYQKNKKAVSPIRQRFGWFFLGIFTSLSIVGLTTLLYAVLF